MADGLPLDSESMASGDPGAAAALDLGGQTTKSKDLRKVASAEDYEMLPHGASYLDPEGKQRYKPIRNKEDWLAVEEGAEYADPSGEIRTKPYYEGVDFTAQTLYDIAHSDKGRKMALEKFYPGKVREDPSGGFYIEDEGGKLRKPGRGLSAATGFAASEAIPGALGAVGSVIGGGVGTVAEPGGGTAVGGAAGAYGGGYMGQRINDIFAQLAGVYDPEGGEANARMAGVASAAGDVGGRALFAAFPVAKEAGQRIARGASKVANKFLGTNKEALETALPIAEAGEKAGPGFSPLHPTGALSKPGTAVSPSAIFESSPHLTNVAEILQQKFDRSDTYLANAEKYMDKKAKEILASKDIGSIVEGSLVHPTAAVPTEKAGILLKESAQAKAVQASAEADARLHAELNARKSARMGVQADMEMLHGYSEYSGFNGFKPLSQVDDAVRYDGGNGVFGKATYLDPTGKWIKGKNGALAHDAAVKVQGNFNRLFVLTPENIGALESIVGKDAVSSGPRIAENLKALGFDGIQTKGFDSLSEAELSKLRGNVDSSVFQDQVAAFFPERSLRVANKLNIPKKPAEGFDPGGSDRYFTERGKTVDDAVRGLRPAQIKEFDPIEAHRARNSQVIQTAEQAKTAADNLVQEGFRDIERQANDALKVAKAGYNSGDLWRTVAKSFVDLRASIQSRATKMYGDAETAAGGLVPPGSNGLAQPAQQLLAELPEGFESLHPSIVRKLRDIAGVKDEKTGEWIKEPADATWVQLHNLRSQIRQDIKWNDLTSDIRNGTLKFLDKKINEVLHPVEESVNSSIKEASRLLKLADGFYRENMGPLNQQQLKALVRALDVGGIQADPKALLKVAIRDGQTEVAETIKKTVGPQTWDALRAADVKDMLAQSVQIGTGDVDGVAFARQVLDRKRNGVLEVLHGKEGAGRLEKQAAYVEALRGKLDIKPKPGDTANDIILRARSAAADAENLAKTDPLKALANEMKKVEAATRREMKASQPPDPLAFLTNATVGANAAVDKLLGDPDLIVAASRAFPGGEMSPEFQLMRQVWTERFMRETLEPGERLAATSPEIQALMFPGVTLEDMHMLAREMKLLMSGATMRGGGGDMGGSIMAQSAVENPLGRASGLGKLAGPAKVLPGVNFGARAALTAYYNTVRGLLTSPSTLRWLRKGLQSRDPVARENARAELQAAIQKGGAMGSSTGSALHQYSQQPDQGVLE